MQPFCEHLGKFEIRSTKSETNLKIRIPKARNKRHDSIRSACFLPRGLEHLGFGFVSDFGFEISDLVAGASPR
jgi:hypothetical protein